MKFNSLFLVFTCLWLNFGNLEAQNNFDIIFPGNDRNQKCKECLKIFREKPLEVKFSIVREGSNLYFQINDKNWFDLIFKNPKDGIAVDIVSKSIYDCKKTSIEQKQVKGLLLKPIYAQTLKKGLKPSGKNKYRVYVGKVPESLNKERDIEYNILFLSNKVLCQYYLIYNLESYPWDLLDMGMYLDEITYNTKKIKPLGSKVGLIRNKTLKFRIPFKKNKSQYSQADIKPIYDSLRITDFNIKSIKIKAYSSVEGSYKRNSELQKQRAKSIVSALQKFQKSTIKTKVSSSENWVEFLNDIKGTRHAALGKLNKSEVRAKLVGSLLKQLEPVLKNHRKATLELELEKKDKFKEMTASDLISKFNSVVLADKLDQAIEIQNSIFQKIKTKESPLGYLKKMNIPMQIKFAKLLNKNFSYRSMLDVRQILIVYNRLLELEKMVPNDADLKYNIVAIKMKLWRHKGIQVNEDKLKAQINALKKYKTPSSFISRMMVNFHVIKAENFMEKRDFSNKNKSVAYVNANYKKFDLSDYDYSSLAQFFSYYGTIKMAVDLLKDKVKSIDVDENLLFYYLNLTMLNPDLTNDSEYRTIMLNAINMNKTRYCKLFNTVRDGGVTFQLLEDSYLRNAYCENCEN